eukprot:15203-Heterococcus_DN1.PRE.3
MALFGPTRRGAQPTAPQRINVHRLGSKHLYPSVHPVGQQSSSSKVVTAEQKQGKARAGAKGKLRADTRRLKKLTQHVQASHFLLQFAKWQQKLQKRLHIANTADNTLAALRLWAEYLFYDTPRHTVVLYVIKQLKKFMHKSKQQQCDDMHVLKEWSLSLHKAAQSAADKLKEVCNNSGDVLTNHCTPAYITLTTVVVTCADVQLLPAEAQPEELNWSGKSQPPSPPTTLALAQYEQSSSSDTSSISSSDAHSDSASSSDSSGEDCDAPQAGLVDDVADDVTDDVSDLVTAAAALASNSEGARSDVDDDMVSTASSDSDLASIVSDTLAEVTAAAAEQQAAALRTLHKHVSASGYVNSLYAQLQQQSGTELLTVDAMKAALKQCLADCRAGTATADEQQDSLVRYALKQLVKVAKQQRDTASSGNVLQEWLQCLDAKAHQAAEKLRKRINVHNAFGHKALALLRDVCTTLYCEQHEAKLAAAAAEERQQEGHTTSAEAGLISNAAHSSHNVTPLINTDDDDILHKQVQELSPFARAWEPPVA